MALFVGTYDRKIDGKDRVVIPSDMADAIRDESGGRLYLVPDQAKRCIEAYPAQKFQQMAQKHSPDRFEGDLRKVRSFFQRAQPVLIKGPGRITIPDKSWIETYFPAGVVRVAGMADYLELWDPERWARDVEDDVDEGGAGFLGSRS